MDVSITQLYTIKLNDHELRTIMRALGRDAGLKIQSSTKVDGEDRAEAARLNEMFLRLRATTLREQLKVAEGALEKAQAANPDSELQARVAKAVGEILS